jgi:hypothetical protein
MWALFHSPSLRNYFAILHNKEHDSSENCLHRRIFPLIDLEQVVKLFPFHIVLTIYSEIDK